MNDMNFLNATTTSMNVSEFSGISNGTFVNATNYNDSMSYDNNNNYESSLFDKVSFQFFLEAFYNHHFI